MITRIVAPSRLHFGLFHVPVPGERRANEKTYGGVGLMIDTPGVVVTAKPADTWRFEGPLASRAQNFAMRLMQSLPEENRRPFQVLVERCPREHTGLGVGTQLGLAVAKALAVGMGLPDCSSTVLAIRIERGERSAVGVHGFDRGGLLIENGKLAPGEISELVECIQLPHRWRVMLFTASSSESWSGMRESRAFETAKSGDRDVLQRIAETRIIPAAKAGDLELFGEAIHELNRLAGEPFAAIQGGTYSSPAICELISELRQLGIRGVGQSSWGPTVFAIVDDSDTALSLALRFKSRMPVLVARVSMGHRMERG